MGKGHGGFAGHGTRLTNPSRALASIKSQPWKKVCLQQKASGNHDYSALKRNILDFLAPSFVQF